MEVKTVEICYKQVKERKKKHLCAKKYKEFYYIIKLVVDYVYQVNT